MKSSRRHLEHDWYPVGIPGNVETGADVYLDSSYSFALFHSECEPGLTVGDAAGVYDRTAFIVGPHGKVRIGEYTCLNATYLIANRSITIGRHCLLAWGSVITDSWPAEGTTRAERSLALIAVAADRHRMIAPVTEPAPVTLEDNVWVGFDSVILPGVTLGRGCLVGCKTMVREDVEPYAILVGDPPRVVRFLRPDDSEEARAEALAEYRR